jgi:hypothetical protein
MKYAKHLFLISLVIIFTIGCNDNTTPKLDSNRSESITVTGTAKETKDGYNIKNHVLEHREITKYDPNYKTSQYRDKNIEVKGNSVIVDYPCDKNSQCRKSPYKVIRNIQSIVELVNSTNSNKKFITGIGPISAEYPGTQETWLDMFEKFSEIADIVIAQGGWRESMDKSGEIPELMQLLQMQKETYGFTPQFGLGFFDNPTQEAILDLPHNPTNDWTNEESKEMFKSVALEICEDYQPKYLALGIEVNTYYRINQDDFSNYVEAYKEMYDELKPLCPDTNIFVTFQLEELKGVGGDIWGEDIDPHWELFTMFEDKLDLIAFTTYPEIEFVSPNDIPRDYYEEIRQYSDKTIAFTEIGWSSAHGFTGEKGGRYSEQNQVDFISKFVELTNDLDVELANWAFMHDLPDPGPLTKIGLRNSDSSTKPAWDKWKELKEKPFRP